MEKVISVRLSQDLLEKTEAVSAKLKRSRNWIVREVLENYLEEMYDVEEAKRILLDKTDKLIDHEQAKKEILSD
jgi:predicted DNA-binding protein